MALRWARFAEEESWPRWPSVVARLFYAGHLGFAKRLAYLEFYQLMAIAGRVCDPVQQAP